MQWLSRATLHADQSRLAIRSALVGSATERGAPVDLREKEGERRSRWRLPTANPFQPLRAMRGILARRKIGELPDNTSVFTCTLEYPTSFESVLSHQSWATRDTLCPPGRQNNFWSPPYWLKLAIVWKFPRRNSSLISTRLWQREIDFIKVLSNCELSYPVLAACQQKGCKKLRRKKIFIF